MEAGGKCFYNSHLHAGEEGNKVELYKAGSTVEFVSAPTWENKTLLLGLQSCFVPLIVKYFFRELFWGEEH